MIKSIYHCMSIEQIISDWKPTCIASLFLQQSVKEPKPRCTTQIRRWILDHYNGSLNLEEIAEFEKLTN